MCQWDKGNTSAPQEAVGEENVVFYVISWAQAMHDLITRQRLWQGDTRRAVPPEEGTQAYTELWDAYEAGPPNNSNGG